VAYDAFHKGNPAAPIVMGLCRALIYGAAAAAVSDAVALAVSIAGLALLAYVAGLTYAARQESFDRVGNLWPLAVLAIPMLVAWPGISGGAVAVLIYFVLIASTLIAVYLLAARPMAGAVPRSVGLLIAGISLLDATFLAGAGALGAALIAALGFPATLLLHKLIPGT
jgi:hypothetical protein